MKKVEAGKSVIWESEIKKEKEKGKEKEVLLGEFFDDLVRQNKGFNENTKLYFLLFPEDLVYILNDIEKRGRKYKVKYK